MADQESEATYTRRLSRDIDAAYETYKAGEPGASERLLAAFLAQARNVGRYRLREMYFDTVAYDAAHRAMLALESFRGECRVSTWFFQVALNEVLREQERLLEKRGREDSINVPVRDGESDETEVMELADPHPSDQTPALDVAKLRQDLPPKQAQVLDLMAEGHSLEQIAEMTGLKLGTVRSRYRLAKDKMRRKTRPNEAKQ